MKARRVQQPEEKDGYCSFFAPVDSDHAKCELLICHFSETDSCQISSQLLCSQESNSGFVKVGVGFFIPCENEASFERLHLIRILSKAIIVST